MSRPLQAVPGPAPAGPPTAAVIGAAPTAGPLDEIGRLRLRRAIETHLGQVPNVDAHLDLVDTRGAWYAAHAISVWDPAQGEAFFGLIRHVVRTQTPVPPPAPDLEGWLAAGRPYEADLAPLGPKP